MKVLFELLVLVLVVVFWLFKNKEQQVKQMLDQLGESGSDYQCDIFIPENLPPPVYRYLLNALPAESQVMRQVTLTQRGVLRINTKSQRWLSFAAVQKIAPMTKAFVWLAKVKLFKVAHVQVIDSYINGIGSGSVNLFSVFNLDQAVNEPALNSGALHRYLAEAVWYPTALLPQFGVVWSAKDNRSAVATLTDKETSVSLEFRFNEADEVVGIYSAGRYGRFGGKYQQVAWEGHFSAYQRHQGLLLPGKGEVGWYHSGKLQLVWKGVITDIEMK
jgi:hypothetical protein